MHLAKSSEITVEKTSPPQTCEISISNNLEENIGESEQILELEDRRDQRQRVFDYLVNLPRRSKVFEPEEDDMAVAEDSRIMPTNLSGDMTQDPDEWFRKFQKLLQTLGTDRR